MPGMVPDRSSVPGHHGVVVPAAERPVRRPLTEYGTAQQIMRMYRAAPGDEMNPKRFESVPVSDEEIRKADPDLGRPMRPLPGYALGRGAGAATVEAFEAIEAAEAAALPAPSGRSPSTATIGTDAQAIQPGTAAASAASATPSASASASAPMATPPATASSGAAGPSSQPLPGEASPAARAIGIASPNVVAGEQGAPPAAVESPAAGVRPAEAAPAVGQGKAAALATAATRRGALRGSGSYDCPASHPVKGNAQSGIYHTPDSASYKRTIPEFCFRAAADAEAAGFRAPR
jgi:hypothetical protein